MELAGEIESVGKDVIHFKVDDKVFATTGMAFGAHAEYTYLSEHELLAILVLKTDVMPNFADLVLWQKAVNVVIFIFIKKTLLRKEILKIIN